MTGLHISGLALFVLLLGACATPQSINIETTPSGAAISVDSEYVGRSPAKIDLPDVGHHKELRIVAEKSQYESAVKTITKKRSGKFPKSVFLKLEPKVVQETSNRGGGYGGSQQQTTIQGPTIVMPGAGPAPQVSSPPPN